MNTLDDKAPDVSYPPTDELSKFSGKLTETILNLYRDVASSGNTHYSSASDFTICCIWLLEKIFCWQFLLDIVFTSRGKTAFYLNWLDVLKLHKLRLQSVLSNHRNRYVFNRKV